MDLAIALLILSPFVIEIDNHYMLPSLSERGMIFSKSMYSMRGSFRYVQKEDLLVNQFQPTIAWSTLESPVGNITVAMSQQGLCYLDFPKTDDPILGLRVWASKQARSAQFERNEQVCTPVLTQLKEYFDQKRKDFDLPIDLTGTPFQQLVYRQLCQIPYGTVASYKQIAEAIGAPKAVRAVGGANNKNPIPIIVPCHRVIGANGSLVGYGGGLEIKKILLKLEGSLEKTV